MLKQLSLYSLLAGVVMSIFFALPITDNFVAHTKTYGLFALAIFVGLLFVVRSFKRNSFDVVLSPLTIPLFAFSLSVLISTFFTNTYPVENLLGFGGVYLAVTTIALLGSSLLPKHSTDQFLLVLGGSGVVLFLLSLFQSLGFGPAQLFNQIYKLELPSDFGFNLVGSSFIAIQLVVVSLVGLAINSLVDKRVTKPTAILVPILLIAAVVYGWSLLPGKPGAVQLPSAAAGWSIALDTLRLPKPALIGVGPATYSNVYNLFRPIWVNSQPYWNVQFNQAINMPLNLLTTMGVIGLATWLFLAWRIVKMYKTTNKENRGLMAAVLAMLGLQLLLPANVVMLTIFGIALAILVGSEKHKHSVVKLHPLSVKITTQLSSDQEVLGSAKKAKLFSPFSAVVVVLIVGLVSLAYFAGRTYAAQVLMNESSKAVARNDVLGTYQKQQAAVRLNPYLDALRRRYAATNMLIAIAVSNKVDATQEDQNQVGQLLQQAIREARAATILDPGDVENWLTLAQIYQNMNGVADEAVDWTIQSYVSAIETSPADPTLRLSLGGIFLAQQDFNQAANFFQQSVALKPDFANGYYNLAAALKELGQLEQSKAAYQQVLVLIDTGSDDYTRVTSELEELEKQIAAGQDNGQADTEDESNTPSILNQNLENQAETVRQPNNDVDVNLESPAPAAEPSPNPASPGATLN